MLCRVGLVCIWMRCVNNIKQWYQNSCSNRILICLGGYVKVRELMYTRAIVWVDTILTIGGRFCLGTRALAWCIDPNGMQKQNTVNSHTLLVLKMFLPHYRYPNGIKRRWDRTKKLDWNASECIGFNTQNLEWCQRTYVWHQTCDVNKLLIFGGYVKVRDSSYMNKIMVNTNINHIDSTMILHRHESPCMVYSHEWH